MTHTDKALRYIADVMSGKQPACKWVKLACQRQLDDLGRQNTPEFPFVFNEKAANRVCKFIEQMPHIRGFHGKLKLEDWQAFIYTTVFGWLHADSDHLRRFRRVITIVPRGNGKSAMTAPLGLYMTAMDNEPGAECYVAATSLDQTRHVYTTAQHMARRTPEFTSRYGVEVGERSITQQSTASFFRALASRVNSLDGLNIHLGIIDELHAHPTREVYDSMDTGTGKRDNSLLWCITTAGTNRAGICYDRQDYVQRILEKKCEAETWFGIIYTIDDGDDWATEAALRKANPNWGISVKPSDVLPKLKEAMQLASAAPNFKTKHLNIWVGADAAWMDMQRWNKCADTTLDEKAFAGQKCILGLDLASKLDLLSLSKIFWREEETKIAGHEETQMKRHYYVFSHNWTNEENLAQSKNSQYQGWEADGHLDVCPGATNDYDLVEAYIRDACRKYQVIEVAHDPYQAVELVNHLSADAIVMVEIGQTALNLSNPMKEVEAAVHDGRFHFNGDPVLSWAISNVSCHVDRNDNIFPGKERPDNKIDPATSLFTGMNRVMFQAAQGTADISSFGDCEKCGKLCVGTFEKDRNIYLCPEHLKK